MIYDVYNWPTSRKQSYVVARKAHKNRRDPAGLHMSILEAAVIPSV